MKPIFSILIPTYNQENYIQQAIESALNQNFHAFEVVVLDDCSTDNTKDICVKYKNHEKFRYIQNYVRLGRVKNYRNGLYNHAKGEWVLICDGDDYYLTNDVLSDYYKAIEKQKNLVLLQGSELAGKNPLESHKKIPDISTTQAFLSGLDYIENYFRIKHFSHLSSAYKRELAINLNFYSKDISSSDIHSILKLPIYGDVYLTKKIYGLWRMHKKNHSQNLTLRDGIKNIECYIDLIQFYKSKIKDNKKNIAVYIEWKKYFRAKSKGLLASAIVEKSLSDIIRIIRYIIKNDPFILVWPNYIRAVLSSIKDKIN